MESNFKYSFYNIFLLSTNNKSYLWNTYTGTVIKLDKDAVRWMQRFAGADDGSDYFQTLRLNGCIVDTKNDEISCVIQDEKAAHQRRYSDLAHFMIVPGLGCNYHCHYCFEQAWSLDRSCKMTAEVADAIVDRLKDCIDHGAKRCAVEWFGGEPLLYLHELLALSEKLITVCNEFKIPYRAHVTTNGSLLTAPVIKKLADARVDSVQITVDGPKAKYCAIKGATERQFDTTIANIDLASRKIKNGVTVRINTDGSNYDEVKELVDFLLGEHNLQGKIKLWIAPIRELDAPQESTSLSKCAELSRKIEQYCAGKYPKQKFRSRFPRRISSSCGRICASSISVGPEGELYTCDEHVGKPEYVIGNIVTNNMLPEDSCIAGVMRNLEHDEQCLKCKVFPLCLSGCANVRMHHKAVFDCPTHIEDLVAGIATKHGIEKPVKVVKLDDLKGA